MLILIYRCLHGPCYPGDLWSRTDILELACDVSQRYHSKIVQVQAFSAKRR